jgi:hypothetical protein
MNEKFPHRLYHYPSSTVLLSILERKSIRLYGHWHLNDYTEGKLYGAFVDDMASTLGLPPANAQRVKATLESGDAYVHCLSTHSDTLSQWRGYAMNGAGVSIGINPQVLLEIAKGQSTLFLSKVSYADVLTDLPVNPWHVLIREMLTDERSPGSDFLQSAMKELWSIKSKAFEEESEFRLLFTPELAANGLHVNPFETERSGATVKRGFQAMNDSVRDYYELMFSNEKFSDLITEVTLGPTNQSHPTVVKHLLMSMGLPNVEVKKSSASYR